MGRAGALRFLGITQKPEFKSWCGCVLLHFVREFETSSFSKREDKEHFSERILRLSKQARNVLLSEHEVLSSSA